jgi:amidase
LAKVGPIISSGGAAAAVAAGLSAAEIGSDIGGSIRVPAHFCGIYGHNPSYGLVPLAGHIPPPPGSLAELPMATIGPLARSAFDLKLMLDVMAMPTPSEIVGRPPLARRAPREQIRDFRIAVWADDNDYPIEPSYMAAIAEFTDTVRRLGAKVVTVSPPVNPEESREVYALTLFGMWAASLSDEIYEVYASAARTAPPDDRSWRALVGRGSAQSLRDWNRLVERREQMRQKWATFFEDFDVLICRVISALAFRHTPVGTDHTGQLRARVDIGSRSIGYLDLLLWPGVITLPKLPSTVVPLPHKVDHRPAGVQLVSAYLDDDSSLRLAQLLETEIGGFVPPQMTYAASPPPGD